MIQQPLITTMCVHRLYQSRTSKLTTNTAYILCNRIISLTNFDGKMMGLILHEELSASSGHYISMVKFSGIC